MFFAKAGEYEACGMFTIGHFILIVITIIGIIISLKKTVNKSKQEIKKIIKKMTLIVWICEIIKIIFNLCIGNLKKINEYIPLYYCSLLLYTGIMASFGKGKIKRIGEVFLAIGGIIGGITFIILPTTSISIYPMFHYLSLYSFFFHGTMVYLGLLINLTQYIIIEKKDIIYYSGLVGGICIIALIINKIFDSNLMFISKDFPGTPIHYIYFLMGKFFTPVVIILQMTLPFLIMYNLINIIKNVKITEKCYDKIKLLK